MIGNLPPKSGFASADDGAEARKRINDIAQYVRSLAKKGTGNTIELGQLLDGAKKLLPRGDGLPWLEKEFGESGWSVGTAENYINAYRKFPMVGNLAIYLFLSTPGTAQEVRDGVEISHTDQVARISPSDVFGAECRPRVDDELDDISPDQSPKAS